jgi:hypothetical protein
MVNRVITVLRWLVPPAWLAAAATTLWQLVSIVSSMPAEKRLKPDILVIGAVFIAVAIWSLRMAYKHFHEARNAPPPLPPLLPRRPTPWVPKRHPLAEPLRAELLRTIDLLETAGMLNPGEVSRDVIVDCAERVDDFKEMDIVLVAHILHALLGERGTPFDDLAFFPDMVETTDDDPLDMVRELARLTGQSDSLRGLRFRMTGAIAGRGEFPPQNAVVEFELSGRAHVVPFVMYRKNAPGGLTQALARIFTRPDDPRRFFEEGFDSFSILTYVAPGKIAELNAAIGAVPTWVEVK